MSTEYGFRCRTHGPHLSSSHNLRRHQAETLFARRVELPIVIAFDNDMLINWMDQIGEHAYWLGQHPNCDVVIEDEYGRLEAEWPKSNPSDDRRQGLTTPK